MITPNWVPPERKSFYAATRNDLLNINFYRIYICRAAKFKGYLYLFIDRRAEQCPERALLVWSPNPALAQMKRKS